MRDMGDNSHTAELGHRLTISDANVQVTLSYALSAAAPAEPVSVVRSYSYGHSNSGLC